MLWTGQGFDHAFLLIERDQSIPFEPVDWLGDIEWDHYFVDGAEISEIAWEIIWVFRLGGKWQLEYLVLSS